MCGNISVERSPIFSRLIPRFDTQNGREQMSITARDSAYSALTSALTPPTMERRNGKAHLVQGREARAVPLDAADLTEGLFERRAEGYRAVL